MIRAALRTIGVYFYILPTFAQAKRVIWDSILNNGMRFLDFIPPELIASTNGTEMKISLTNGSLIQLLGSDNYDNSLVGTNPRGIVFSEYALQDPRAYQFARPILTANGGWAMFLSTPRGHNHLYELWQIALHNPSWFPYKLTVEQTGHIPLVEIEKERREGILSEDLIMQEYYTSFDMGIEGSYYAKYIDKARVENRITFVPYEPNYKVFTAWDLGHRDKTCIIFFQVIGQMVRIIDYYENNKESLQHYAKIVSSKPYVYGKHIGPHDIRVHDLSLGVTRWEMMRQMGITFTVAPQVEVEDGIEACRAAFSKIWIDSQKCEKLIKALENYRQEYDTKRKTYKGRPLHDWASDAADSFRYLCLSLSKTRDGLSPEDLDKRYRDAVYGSNNNMPAIFRDDLPRY